MKEVRFRAWHLKENRMYFRAYQKWFHVLLCEDDGGENAGNGRPTRRAFYGDCVLLESTGLRDRKGREVFEGDVLRVKSRGREVTAVVGGVPDTFGSRVHALQSLFDRHGLSGNPDDAEIEVLGNEYENPGLVPKGAAR